MSGAVQVVRLTVWGVDRMAPALARMALDRRRLRGVEGLGFAKLLGTGSGQTFTPRDADPHHWALLTVWHGQPRALPTAAAWDDAAHERLEVTMTPVASRGRWSRREPFVASSRPEQSAQSGQSGPVAAITRARLRPRQLGRFWSAVPPVVDALAAADGVRLAFGIGEAPIGLQGTFSLWDSHQDLTDFAYRGAAHREVVERTPVADWYAEELFARFAVLDVQGSYRGWQA